MTFKGDRAAHKQIVECGGEQVFPHGLFLSLL